MEISNDVRLSTVSFINHKLAELEGRKSRLEKQHEELLKSLREEKYLYTKILQEACPHLNVTEVPDWDYHNNVNDSYDECKICGKRL